MSKNLGFLSHRKGLTNNLFEELGKAANSTGTPDKDTVQKLKDEFLFGSANLYGTISFYDFLKSSNEGKKVFICNGSSCLTAGTQHDIERKINAYFDKATIGEMCCLGRCHENSAFHYDGVNYSGTDIDKIEAILSKAHKSSDEYKVGSIGQSVLISPTRDIASFYTLFRRCVDMGDQQLLEELEKSGLRGRGGAGFPIAFKLKSCKTTDSKVKFIVCNADEGDPGAYSDRYIMEHQPHKLLLGMMISAYIVGASWGVLYIRAEYPESIMKINEAITQIQELGLLGNNILDSGFDFQFKIIKAQGAYICGEETALLSSIEGQRPEVRIRPPFPTQEGLYNQPTVVNNVETLACVPYIIANGGDHFATIGQGKSTGTKLISLDGHFVNPGIYEVEMGTALSKVIYDLGGGFRNSIKALHIGGPLGGLIPVEMIDQLTVDFESFQNKGFLLGHASVVCIPTDFPIISYIKHLFQFTAHESCGKCFPCRIGSTRGAEMVEKAEKGEYKIDKVLLNDLLETMEVGSLCALGGGLPLPIKNALQYFSNELNEYFHN